MVDPDRCPRCGGPFHCGAQGPGPCPCTTVALDAAQLQALRGAYTGCLCLDCLRRIAAGEPVVNLSAGPAAAAC